MPRVQLSDNQVYEFPDDATPEEIQRFDLQRQMQQVRGEDRVPAWLAQQNQSASGLTQSALQGGELGVGGVLKGLGATTELLPRGSLSGEDFPYDSPIEEENRARAARNPFQKFQDIQSNPLYVAGQALQDVAPEVHPVPEREQGSFLTKTAKSLGEFAPIVATGPLAPATIGLQSMGEHIGSDFEQGKANGLSDDDAAASAMTKAIASGGLQAAIFAILPKPLRDLGDKYLVDKFGNEAARFIAKRAAAAGETGAVFGTSHIGEQAIEGRPITEGLPEAIGAGALMGAATPRGPSVGEQEMLAEPPAWLEAQRRGYLMQNAVDQANARTAIRDNPAEMPLVGTWNKTTPEGDQNAITTGKESENVNSQLPRIETRQDIRPNEPEIRQDQGTQANGGDQSQGSGDVAPVEQAPVDEIKTPPLPPNHQPVEIERPDGTRYQAAFGGYWNDVPGKPPVISRVNGDTWSTGSLNEGEKIVSEVPPPLRESPTPPETQAPESAPTLTAGTAGEVRPEAAQPPATPETTPVEPQTPPGAAKFKLTFEQFLEAPREGELLDALRTLPKPEPTPKEAAAKSRLDAASEAVDKAGLSWIYDRADASKAKMVDAALRKLPKTKKKIVDEYEAALTESSKSTVTDRQARQKQLYDRAVEAGIIENPKTAEPQIIPETAPAPTEPTKPGSTGDDLERIKRKLVDAEDRGMTNTESYRKLNRMFVKLSRSLAKEETGQSAEAKIEAEIKEVARTEGQRPAKEVKSELVRRLEDAAAKAPSERDATLAAQQALENAKKGPTVSGNYQYGKKGDAQRAKDVAAATAKLESLAKDAGFSKITIDIPNDGTFKVWNTKEAIAEVLDAAKRIKTSDGGPSPGISRSRLDANEYLKRDVKDALTVYGTDGNAHKKLSAQLAMADELGLEPDQIKRLEKLVKELKERIEAPWRNAQSAARLAEQRLESKAKFLDPKDPEMIKLQAAVESADQNVARERGKVDEQLKPEKGASETEKPTVPEAHANVEGNRPGTETPESSAGDEAGIHKDLQSSGAVLWTDTPEINRIFVSAKQSGRGSDTARTKNLISGKRVPVRSNQEMADRKIFEQTRVFLGKAEPGEVLGRAAEILAHRLLIAPGKENAALFPGERVPDQVRWQADGLHTLFVKLKDLRVMVRDLGEKGPLAKYETLPGLGDFISLNSRELEKSNLSNPENLAQWDAVLTEELLHAATARVTSRKEIEDMWRSLSPEEQSQTRIAYDPDSRRPNMTPYELGMEYSRIILQDTLTGNVSEHHGPLTQAAKVVLGKILNFLREAFGAKPENDIARQIIGRIESAIKGEEPIRHSVFDQGADSIESGIRQAGEKNADDERYGDTVQIAGVDYNILGKDKITTEQKQAGDAKTQAFVSSLKLPGDPDLSTGGRRGSTDPNLVFQIKPDGFNYDAEGRALIDHIVEQIKAQHIQGGDPAYVSSLVNMVNKNFNEGNWNGVLSPPLINELMSVTAAESSFRGQMLRAITGLRDDLTGIAHNAEIFLRRTYAQAFGGNGLVDTVIKRIATDFRQYFTESELDGIMASHPALTDFFDRVKALMRQESGDRLYKIIQGTFKPKTAKKMSTLEASAVLNEEAAKIIEELGKFGIKPTETPGKKKLEPMEALKLMMAGKTQERIEADVERAIANGERNAGIKEALSQEKNSDRREEMSALFAQGVEDPTPEMIEAGLKRPEFAHWQAIRDNWTGYSPTSIDLVRRVIKGEFKGTRFEDPKVKPADTRINLDALAKAPEAEVGRVIDGFVENVRKQIDLDTATPEAKARVEKLIKDEVTGQLEKARQRARDPMFKEPAEPGVALTPEQRIGQLLNAGLFKDPRLDIAGMVERVADKSAIQRLTPKLGDLVKQVFDTPIYRQGDLSQRFADALVKELGIDPAQADKAKAVFDQAFAAKFKEAKTRALAAAKEALAPKEKVVFAKRSLWQKVERLVNAGGLDSADLLQQIARERGYEIPDPADVAALRDLAVREQKLRELTPEKIAQMEAAGKTPDQIEEARRKVEAATLYKRADLIKRMGIVWSRMVRPLPLDANPGAMAKLWWEHKKNWAQALNELETFNMLAKAGFTLYRLPMHLTTQLLGHLPTRAIARAMEERKIDLANGNPTRFWKDAAGAMQDSVQATFRALRPALVAARAEMLGRGESRNVDRLLSGINAVERLFLRAKDYWDKGDYVRSVISHLFAWPRVIGWYISAVDHWQGAPVEYQEMIHQIEISMREKGRSQGEIDVFKKRVFDMMRDQVVQATAEAKQILEDKGEKPTDLEAREAGWQVVKRNIYGEMKRAGLSADDFQADNKILADTQSWQVQTNRGIGTYVAAPVKMIGRMFEDVGLPVSFGRFSNAIATSVNYSMMWTPLYKLANMRGFGKDGDEPSTWFRTDLDRSQRLSQALLGTAMGGTALSLMAAGVLRMNPPWIQDKNERDKFEREGHKLNTAEFLLPNGHFIPVSVLVGPLTLIAPFLYAGGAVQTLMEKRAGEQDRLNKEAQRHGVPAGKIAAISTVDVMTIAGATAWGAILGNRTVSGLTAAATEYGSLNAKKQIASYIAPLVPSLPGYQEISRMEGVQLDSKLASVWDYLVPLPTSKARAVNVLGDPTSSPNDIQRIIQVITSGTYPLPVDPKDAQAQKPYAVLFSSGYHPPAISPERGYVINGELRPMNDVELQKFTQARGDNFKQILSTMTPSTDPAAAGVVKKALEQATLMALASVGATQIESVNASAGAGGGAPPTAGSSNPTSARISTPGAGLPPSLGGQGGSIPQGGVNSGSASSGFRAPRTPGGLGRVQTPRLASGGRAGGIPRARRLITGRLPRRSGGRIRVSRSRNRRRLAFA